MAFLRLTIIFLFILLTTTRIFSQDKALNLENISEVYDALPESEQQQILDYANYLLIKSEETPEGKEERLFKADNVIPTEETSNKIMEFSRYMMTQQKTTEQKIKEEAKPKAKIKFDDINFDFGKAKEGEKLEHTYVFKNESQQPLYIYEVTTSCGCTIADWTKDAILPSEKGQLKVVFDTKGKKGKQVKLLKVLTNTEPSDTSLFIKGIIE